MPTKDMLELNNPILNRILVYFGIVFIIFSCQHSMNIDEFKSFIFNENNGFLKSEIVGQTKYSILLSHPQFEAIKRLDNEKELSKSTLDSVVLTLVDQFIFYFRITNLNGTDILKRSIESNEEYNQRLQYLLGDIQNDFILISNQDTNKCMIHHFERGYGLNPSINITLAFEKELNQTDFTVVYDDKLFGAGNIKYKFSAKDINKQFDITSF